jgi:hypothetical protein
MPRGHVNEISGRQVQCLTAHLNGQRPLLQIERFILTRVNVRRRTSSGCDAHLGHKKRSTGLRAGDQERNPVSSAAIGGSRFGRHVLYLVLI